MGHVELLAASKPLPSAPQGPMQRNETRPQVQKGSTLRQYYSGMFPCFFAGFLSRFVPSISRA